MMNLCSSKSNLCCSASVRVEQKLGVPSFPATRSRRFFAAVGGQAHHHHRHRQHNNRIVLKNLNHHRKRMTTPPPRTWRSGNRLPTTATTAAASPRNRVIRFLNPWVDLADVTTDDTLLSFKIDSVTRTFGVVAALMCSLSAAALAVTPSADDEEEEVQRSNTSLPEHGSKNNNNNNGGGGDHTEQHHLNYYPHVSGSSLLVRYWGIPARTTHDLYTGCCAGAFYSSVGAMGLSAVINAWLAATPLGGTRYFVRYHSIAICAIPGLLAISTGLAGVSLFIGLDRRKGTPISYIGLGGTLLGGLLIGSTTVRGMICTYRLLTPLVATMKKL